MIKLGEVCLDLTRVPTLSDTTKMQKALSEIGIPSIPFGGSNVVTLDVFGDGKKDFDTYVREYEREIIRIFSQSGLLVNKITAKAAEVQTT